jgi:hypothetical protein
LTQALQDGSSTVRSHAAWALGQVERVGQAEATHILSRHRMQEVEHDVLEETELALQRLTSNGATHVA